MAIKQQPSKFLRWVHVPYRLQNKVVAMLAPRIIGGAGAPGAVGGTGAPSLAAAPLLHDVSVETAGPDLVVTGYCVG